MSTPLLYVAGPYSANETYSEQDHIKRAEQVSIQLIIQGFHVITPHKNTSGYEQYEDDNITFDTWIEMDLNILKRCDGIYLFGDWNHSKGAMVEYGYAQKNTMPVFIERLFPSDILTIEDFYRVEKRIADNLIKTLEREMV
jgi:nucleoside 2-deoxyribosyltransferase